MTKVKTGFNALRGTMIVQLFPVERSIESMDGEISYIVKVIDIGPPVDDVPLGFEEGDYVKLKAIEGFRWEHDGVSYHATSVENAQLKMNGYMEIPEQHELNPYK